MIVQKKPRQQGSRSIFCQYQNLSAKDFNKTISVSNRYLAVPLHMGVGLSKLKVFANGEKRCIQQTHS